MTLPRGFDLLRGTVALAGALAVMILARPSAADPSNGSGPGVYGESTGTASTDSLSGAMVYSYPFHLPSARGSVQPSLALTYSSASGDGEAGYGWGVSLPMIERRPLSGWPKFDAAGNPSPDGGPAQNMPWVERYTFSGRALVQVCADAGNCSESGPHPAWANGWAFYRLQVDDLFARLYRSGNRQTWRIQLKGGERIELGVPLSSNAPNVVPSTCDAVDRDEANPNGIVRYRVTHRFDPGHPSMSVVAYCWKKLGTRGLSFLTDIWDTPRIGAPTNLGAFAHHTQLDWRGQDFVSTNYAKVDKAAPDRILSRVTVASATWSGIGDREIIRSYDLDYLQQRVPPTTLRSRHRSGTTRS